MFIKKVIVPPLFKLYRPEEYKKKVSEYVKKYATEEALRDPSQV